MNSSTQHIQNLVVLAHIDGVIDQDELNLLRELAEEIGISAEELNHWLENANELVLKIPSSNKEREEHLINMINLSNSDGHFSHAEYELCLLVSEKLPFNGLRQAISKRMNRSYLKNLVALASSDGKIDQSEMDVLKDAALKAEVPEDELKHMIDTVSEYRYYIPESYDDRETQLIQMISLAIADGEFSENEYNLCKMVAEKLDFTERELNMIIKLSFGGKMEFKLSD
jgi:tellurite resistance protein